MEKNFNTEYVYRVWYGGKSGIEKQAFFTDKEDAKQFAESVNGQFNIWSWEIKIEN